jgi:choline dehydrogenase-like flavoprotein
MWNQSRQPRRGQTTGRRRETVYDVVIVGSGAAGGTAAWALASAGVRVAMLEAGAQRKHLVDFPYHEDWPYELPYRGLKQETTRSDEFRARYTVIKGNKDEPYTTPEKLPYDWFRTRNVGGRTMFWGRYANRFNEGDFRGYSRDGHGADWPITYADLAPYYDKAERFMGVCGQKENHPDLPDSDHYLPAVALKCPDWLLKHASEKLGIRTIAARRAMLTRPHNGYAPCHYCNGCDEGCETHSFYNSAFRQVAPLQEKYGRTFTLIPNAMARSIDVNEKGLASGVTYFDKTTGQEKQVKARIVIAACGTLETTRLMLLSKSTLFPQGIANSSGLVGRNFMEHLDAMAEGYLPALSFTPPYEGDGIGGSHLVIPWFGYFRPQEKRDFVRGFQIEPSNRIRMRPEKNPKRAAGFGSNFKREVRRWTGTRVRLASHGEMLPGPNKYVELDPEAKDKWGIPVLKIHHPWDDNDRGMFKYLRQTFEEILTAAKAVDVTLPKEPDEPGHSIHEMGTVRMGGDAKTSVLNSFNQSHDVKNLFVVDAAAFTSGSHKNPTLTIMALAWRAAEYMMAEMKKRNL